MQSGHTEFGQQGYSPYGYAAGLSVQNNSGHEMNKPVAAGQPGMYPNSSGMPTAASQHHQSAMASPSTQNATLVQQNQQLSRNAHMNPMQLSNQIQYFPRQNVQRSMSNIGRNQLPVVNQPGQQTSQYQTLNMVQAGYQHHAVPIMMNPQYSYQQRSYPAQPNYIIQTTPPNMYAAAVNNCYNFNGPQPNSNGFYPTHQMTQYSGHGIAPQMPQQQIPPPTIQTSAPRKKPIAIIDPSTGLPISLTDMENNTNSKPEKEESTDTAIGVQFAAQVAATLGETSERIGKPVKVEDSRIFDAPKVVMCPSTVEPQYEVEMNKRIHEPIKIDQHIAKVEDEHTVTETIGNIEYIENSNVSSVEEPVVVYKDIMPNSIINEPVYEEEKCIAQNIDHISAVEARDPKLSKEFVEENVGSFKVDHGQNFCFVPPVKSPVLETAEIHEVPEPKEIVEAPESSQVISTATKVKEDLKVQEVLSEEGNISAAASSKPAEKSQEGKRKQTKKKKDYNKKGESKEGGEMDAFLDKPEEVSVVSPTPQPEPIPPVDQLLSSVTIVDREILDTIPLPGESIDNLPPTDISPSDSSNVSPVNELEDKEDEDDESLKKTLLKYNYKEDHWSPINPEGKKQYDRKFLLDLQEQPMSLCKPLNLPNLEVIRDKVIIHKLNEVSRMMPMPPTQMPKRFDPFLPTYSRPVSGMPHPAINRRTQQGRGGEKARKVISFQSSLTQSIKLHESENAWKPAIKGDVAPVELPTDELEKDKLKRAVQGVLNKLTPQKFETLLVQLKNLNIDTEEKLNVVINLIFEKAIDEPNFSVPYANLCKHLAMIKVPLEGQVGSFVNFRKLLLTKCQKEFDTDTRDRLNHAERINAIEAAEGDKKKELQFEFVEEEKKMRYRQLGNIRFIGELFKLSMLIESIMHECIKKLLQQGDEESLECLCRLLKTIGRELEIKGGNNSCLDTYFAQMKRIVEERLTSSRVRFMLQDVIDLKKCKWVPRRDENNPKTIDEIHQEADREAREAQQVYQNTPNYPKRMPDDRDKRRGAARNQAEDGWTPSSKSKGSYAQYDPQKLKLTKPEEVNNIRLGPGGRGPSSWGRGSSGGAKAAAEFEIKTAVQNKFSALAEQPLNLNYDARRGTQRSAASSRESSRGRSSQMPTPVRKTPSTSKERENLLETVKGLARGAEPKTQEYTKSADVHLNGKATDLDEIALRGPDYSEDEMEIKTKPLIDEFLHNNDSEEAVKCVMELASPRTVHFFIGFAINQVLERSSQARLSLGHLLLSLMKKKIITLDQYKEGFIGILKYLDDYAVDVPKIYEYVGEIIEPVTDDAELPLKCLIDILKPCIPSKSAGLIISAVLHCAAKQKGTIKLGESWKSAGLQWVDILGSQINWEEFVKQQALEFTLSPVVKVKTDIMSVEEIENSLTNLFESMDQVRNDVIFDWIDAHIPETSDPNFICALVTAVHKNVISGGNGAAYDLDLAKLKLMLPVLTRYIQHTNTLQLEALNAIQKLMNVMGHPSGILRQIFDTLYDDDVITEEAFRLWEQMDEDDDDVEGKGVAVHSVQSFFTWLKESEWGEED